MANDNHDQKSSFVVLYLLIILLGLTLAVTVYVFARPHEIFPADQPQKNVAAPALRNGYSQVEHATTGKRYVRYYPGKLPVPAPPDGSIKLTPAKGGGYDLTFTVTSIQGKPYAPKSYEVRIFLHGSTEDSGFTPPFKNVSMGVYTAPIAFPKKGVWDIRVTVHYGNKDENNILIINSTQTIQ